MKDTNAIENAIRSKCKQELNSVVNNFINELETKVRGEYGGVNYYDFNAPNNKKNSFHVMGMQQLTGVLNTMLYNAHLESMVELKSRELVAKLKLEI
tara:strand:+ start:534 stop:824 length:291 start_codon:yes stop_codon:yes gene_type:complete